MLIKYITCKANIDIVTSSKRDRNYAADVMQINFTELKSEIDASQRINASRNLKKSIGDIVYSFCLLHLLNLRI